MPRLVVPRQTSCSGFSQDQPSEQGIARRPGAEASDVSEGCLETRSERGEHFVGGDQPAEVAVVEGEPRVVRDRRQPQAAVTGGHGVEHPPASRCIDIARRPPSMYRFRNWRLENTRKASLGKPLHTPSGVGIIGRCSRLDGQLGVIRRIRTDIEWLACVSRPFAGD